MAGVVFFKEKIKQTCFDNLNLVLNTEIDVKKAEIQFLETFPKLTIQLQDLQIKDAIEGSNDSLMVLKSVELGLDIKKLLVGEYIINSCNLKNGYIHIKTDEKGRHNYAILKPIGDTKESQPFSLEIEDLHLEHVEIRYLDQRVQNNHLVLAHSADCTLDHDGKITDLGVEGYFDCYQIGLFKNKYLENKPFSIDLNLRYDNDEHSVVFGESKLKIENAAFELEGKIIVNEEKLWDLKISSPNTDVQSLISLLPRKISKELGAYKSSGNLYFDGIIKGKQSKGSSPLVSVDFGFDNASFYHPDLNKKITKSRLKGNFTNGKNRNSRSSKLSLKGFKGYLGNDLIEGNVIYENFDSPYLDVDIKGDFAVESALKVYPVKKLKSASGKVHADVNFKGRLSHLRDVNHTDKIKTSGKFQILDLKFNVEGVALDFKGFNGLFYFNKHDLGISRFVGNIGESDFEIKGFFKNFISYLLLDNEVLKVQADFRSELINLDELLSKGVQEKQVSTEKGSRNYSLNLSPFLAYDFDCNIKRVQFRNLSGKDLKGKLSLRDQLLHYQNISMGVANGKVKMNGVINTKDTTRIVVRNTTQIDNISVKKAFFILENFGQDFLTDKNLDGELHATAETVMNFDSRLVMDMNSLSSVADLRIENGALIAFEPMQEMGKFLKKKKYVRYLKSANFDLIKFSELKNTLEIRKGKLNIPEMVVQSDLTSDLTIKGVHDFDNNIDYHVSFPLINYKREERLEGKGISSEGEKKWKVQLSIKGTVEDYEIDLDESQLIKSGLNVATERVKGVFEKDEDDTVVPIDTTGEFDDIIIDEF